MTRMLPFFLWRKNEWRRHWENDREGRCWQWWVSRLIESSEYLDIIFFEGVSTSGSLRRCSKNNIFLFIYHYSNMFFKNYNVRIIFLINNKYFWLLMLYSRIEPGSSFSSWESVARRLRDSELRCTALQFLAPSALHWMISSAFLVWSTVKRDFSVTGIVSREINYGWRPWSADMPGLQDCMIGREAFNHKIYSSLL